MKMRKGMSELMAIVIGVVLTIGIAASLWLVLPAMITNPTKTARVVVSASATHAGEDVVMISLTLRNIGSVDVNITGIKVLIEGNKVTYSFEGSNIIGSILAPGKDISTVLRVSGVDVKPGAKIVVIVSTNHGDVMTTTTVVP